MTTFLQRAKQKGEGLMAEREGLISNPKFRNTSSFLREKQPEESKGRVEKPADKRVEKKQVATFSFPNAPLDYAEEEPFEASEAESGKESLQTKKAKRTEENGSHGENGDDDRSEEKSSEGEQGESAEENCITFRPDRPDPASSCAGEQSRDSTQDELLRAKIKMEMNGYGNSQPQDDKPSGLFGLFRRSGSEMKSMKIATESTKDERTVGETVTHCLQIVVAPEIYADDIEGEGNLGFYRRIRPTPENKSSAARPSPFSGQEHNIHNAIKWKQESTQLQNHVAKLLTDIAKLKLDLKDSNLEAMLWKARAEELQYELKQFRGGDNIDDSSLGCQNRASESEIDHQWQEKHLAGLKEGILVDTEIAPETIEFDPLATKTEKASERSTHD